MILEVAPLDVRPGQAEAFEAAFREANAIISSMPGYLGHELQRCIEQPDRYLLLVRWVSVEAHEVGFRGSAEYQQWKRLLHHFYDPMPLVHHYQGTEKGTDLFFPYDVDSKPTCSIKNKSVPFSAEAFAAEWIAAWNSHDLDRILAHYREDFCFASPLIPGVTGEASGRLQGKVAMRAYWAKALARRPDLHFELIEVLAGVGSLVIHYRRHDGRQAAEVFEFDEAQRVVRSAAHYAEA